jgi:predicted transcriptional regulator
MKLLEIRDALKATVLYGNDLLENRVNAAGGADLMDDILSAKARGSVLLTGLTTEQVIAAAKQNGFDAVVFVRGKKPGGQALEMAKQYNMPVLQTQHSLFVACGRLYMKGLRGLDGSW